MPATKIPPYIKSHFYPAPSATFNFFTKDDAGDVCIVCYAMLWFAYDVRHKCE